MFSLYLNLDLFCTLWWLFWPFRRESLSGERWDVARVLTGSQSGHHTDHIILQRARRLLRGAAYTPRRLNWRVLYKYYTSRQIAQCATGFVNRQVLYIRSAFSNPRARLVQHPLPHPIINASESTGPHHRFTAARFWADSSLHPHIS